MSNGKRKIRLHLFQEDPLVVKSVRLPYWHIRRANKIGNGNFSDGIRLALENFKSAREDRE